MRARGFTLIELLVVMLLLVIILGMVGLSFSGREARAVREEAERLALLTQAAQQEAVLQGRVLALALAATGYEFQTLGAEGEFAVLERDDVLRPRALPPAMQLVATVDGARLGSGGRIVFLPTGDVPLFAVVFTLGEARWRVEGQANGIIRAVSPDA
jgi:general secretion pathway protein H